MTRQKITPCLWFDGNAEAAMKFYRSIFKSTKVLTVNRRGKKVLYVRFLLLGQEFIGLNGGPHFKFTPAISFFVRCKTQAEVDMHWEKLSKGGSTSQCGWVTDKYGVSWQIVPDTLGELMSDPDAKKADRVFEAMLKMTKIDIKGLKRAYLQK